MGVDFYLHWEGQTEDENRAQITGFATVGDKGYIREAYGGNGVFATEVICPEAWDESVIGTEEMYGVLITRSETDPPSRFPGQLRVSIKELRLRKDPAMAAARQRYEGSDYAERHAQAVSDFIDLADRLVSEGKTVWIYSSY